MRTNKPSAVTALRRCMAPARQLKKVALYRSIHYTEKNIQKISEIKNKIRVNHDISLQIQAKSASAID